MDLLADTRRPGMTFLIADDHALFRAGLMQLLLQFDPDATVVEAGDCTQIRGHLGDLGDFDLALLDLYMPGMDDMAGLRGIMDDYPALPVAILSASLEDRDMQRAMELGVMGYIPKTLPPPVLLGAIQLVLSGGIYVPPDMLGQRDAAASQTSRDRMERQPSVELTARQADVLGLVVEGHPNKTIARVLEISEGTVKTHVTAILKALKVDNRTQAARAGSETRIVIRNDVQS